MATTINASTSSGLVETADTSGQLELQSNGTTQLTVSSTGAYGQLKSATAQASTSGTSIDFTSIPSWAKRITVMFSGVSTSGTSNIQTQLGTSGGIVITGYGSQAGGMGVAAVASTTGLILVQQNAAAATWQGTQIITLLGSNTWTSISNLTRTDSAGTITMQVSAGSISLSGTLDRVRITTVNGTDTFDAGSINIMYEG